MIYICTLCLGNICRSPIAEVVFQQLIQEENLENQFKVESRATSEWNEGLRPDKRSVEVLRNHFGKVQIRCRSKQIKKEDFQKFDYILCMDLDNVKNAQRKLDKFGGRSKIELLGKYDPSNPNAIIRDPYYDTDLKGFEKALQQSLVMCKNFLDTHRKK